MTKVLAYDAESIHAVVRSAAAGDEMAFARLVDEHHASMARVAYVICGDPESTHDATQAAWEIAWRRLGSVRNAARIRAWLVAIAANEARKIAQKSRRVRWVDLDPDARASSAGEPVEAAVVDLAAVLRSLKPDERSLLAMRFAAGLEASEIATQLGISASGVRSRLWRLLDRLREDLALEGEEADR